VFEEVWEGVSEEEVWSLFEWDSPQGIKPAFVSFLQLFREGFVSSECSIRHFTYDTEW
jgi:hypothetical protein